MARHREKLPFEIDNYDPVGWLLFHKLGLTTIGIILLQWAYGAFEGLLLPWLEKYEPTFADYIWLAVVAPTFWVYYSLSRIRIPKLFQNLKQSGVIEAMYVDDYEDLTTRIEHSYRSPIWSVLALVASSMIVALIQFQWKTHPPSFAASSWHVFFHLWVISLLNGYAGCLAVMREFIAIYWLRRLFHRFPIHIHPLHPDGAGGLGFIGKHYASLTFFIVAVGMWISLWNFLLPLIQGQPLNLGWEVVFAWILYLIITPLSFFLPLWSSHVTMKQQKETLLQEISNQFDLDFDLARSSLGKDNETIEKTLKKVKSLQDMEQLINSTFPTWPFDSRTLQRFSASALLPVVTSVGSLVIDIFLKQ